MYQSFTKPLWTNIVSSKGIDYIRRLIGFQNQPLQKNQLLQLWRVFYLRFLRFTEPWNSLELLNYTWNTAQPFSRIHSLRSSNPLPNGSRPASCYRYCASYGLISAREIRRYVYPTLHCTPLTDQQEDVHGLIGYFNVLKWTLKAAPRPDVLEHLRQTFKVFLEAFDVSLSSSNEVSFWFVESLSSIIYSTIRANPTSFLLSRNL